MTNPTNPAVPNLTGSRAEYRDRFLAKRIESAVMDSEHVAEEEDRVGLDSDPRPFDVADAFPGFDLDDGTTDENAD